MRAASRPLRSYFFFEVRLLLELDFAELLLELEEEVFLEPLELADLVGMDTLPSGRDNR